MTFNDRLKAYKDASEILEILNDDLAAKAKELMAAPLEEVKAKMVVSNEAVTAVIRANGHARELLDLLLFKDNLPKRDVTPTGGGLVMG